MRAPDLGAKTCRMTDAAPHTDRQASSASEARTSVVMSAADPWSGSVPARSLLGVERRPARRGTGRSTWSSGTAPEATRPGREKEGLAGKAVHFGLDGR